MGSTIFRRPARRAAALLVVASSTAAAQSASPPARYRVQHDTLRYELLNPFRMYWVRGADTIGNPIRAASVETQVWSGTAERPVVRVAFHTLGVMRFARSNEYGVSPAGRVLTIDGQSPAPGERGDLLMPLPDRPLRAGVRWTDTTGTGTGNAAGGEERDETIREWHVLRLFDTLGTRAAEVEARGTWHMKSNYSEDSATHRLSWMDVQGPMEEHDIFDITRGRLIERAWQMDLRGRGVPPSGPPDTVPAGLHSSERVRLSDTPRTRFLLRALPGADTSVTVDTHGTAILLHTIARENGRITSSLSRDDGTVGVAAVEYDGAVPRKYSGSWVDAGDDIIEQHLRRDGARLLVKRSGAHDTALVVPGGAWSIADDAMNELLAPALLSLKRDSVEHPFAVYRPRAGHWDSGTATVQVRAGLLVTTLKLGSAPPRVLVFSPDGDLLIGLNTEPADGRRFPMDTERMSRFRTLIGALQSR